ncbi:MAG: TolC family protein, partial [Planctomycetales bacterium]|nr:TolC family protein [Planctomycetales bacterium]
FGASLAQRLDLGGQRGHRIAAAAAGLERTRAETADSLRGLLAGAAEAFLEALAAEGLLALARESDEAAAGLLSVAEARLRAGDIARSEANLVRLDAAESRAAVREAALRRDAGRARLLALLGEDDRPGLLLEGTLEGGDDLPPPTELVRRALAARPDLRALAAAEAAGEAEARLRGAERTPGVELRAGYEAERGEIEGLTDLDHLVTAGLTLDLPGLWNSGAGEIAEARGRAEAARAERAALAREVAAEALAARRAWEAARERATLRRDMVPLALDNLALARTTYAVGETSTVAVLRARSDAARVQGEALRARLDEALARVAVERATGEAGR